LRRLRPACGQSEPRTPLPQVRWCEEVAEAAMAAADSDTGKIDQEIAALLRKRAAKMVARDSFAQRKRSLAALGETQKGRFRQFLSEHAARDADLRECLRQAKVGLDAGAAFLAEMGALRGRVAEEAAALRVTAHEQLVDAGADLAWAYRLGHSANYMLGYYREQHRALLGRDVKAQLGKYRRALLEERMDVAQELASKISGLEAAAAQDGEEAARLARETAQLEQLAEPALRFLFEHAICGALEPVAPARASVRTGAAGRALWGGDDRVVSLPEEWEAEMRAEAEAGMALLTSG
jgi:hypothetical protein